ncbi:MAG: hypothetical protein MJ219_03710 [Mycoplasmoidaceae bacterium]|nr:hypothetical protein [Mycoplasmoidaceae bacterium]
MAGSTIANQIKGQTYQQYTKTKALTSDNYNIKDIIGIDPTKISTDAINNGVISTYISNRMLSGSNDFATYTDDPETTDFFGTILSNYQTKMAGSLQTDGEYNDDNLNY